MPGMDGFELVSEFRRWEQVMAERCPGRRRQYIAGMSANVSNSNKGRSCEVGMDKFLAKPISKQNMLGLIHDAGAAEGVGGEPAAAAPPTEAGLR